MSVDVFPGGFRIGVLNVQKNGLQESAWQELTPKFQLLILLNGRHIFEIGSRCFDMDARDHPSALMMVIRSETLLRHIESAGHPYRKLAVAAPLEWAANMDILPRAMQGDDNWFRQWCPNRETIGLATQIIAPPPWEGDAKNGLYRMSRSLEILRRIIANTPPQEGGLSTIAERIRLYLHEHLMDQDISIQFLEAHLGMNRRSLQRKFKAAFGVTIRDYLRQQRLACAYRALSEDGVTIARAAYLAGYTSPENFTTAFRRNFSLRPCEVRNLSI